MPSQVLSDPASRHLKSIPDVGKVCKEMTAVQITELTEKPCYLKKPSNLRISRLLSQLPQLVIEQMPVPEYPVLEQFTMFVQLPKELRFQIWELIACQPRTINLVELKNSNSRTALYMRWNSNVPGQARHPAIVHINRETRAEALRFYDICEARTQYICKKVDRSPQFPGDFVTNTYFINFDVDTFAHGSGKFDTIKGDVASEHDFNFGPDVLRRIQRIDQRPCYKRALQGFAWIHTDTSRAAFIFRHKIWESLRNVTLFLDHFCMFFFSDALSDEIKRGIWHDLSEREMDTFEIGVHVSSGDLGTHPFACLVKRNFELRTKWKTHPFARDFPITSEGPHTILLSEPAAALLLARAKKIDQAKLKGLFDSYLVESSAFAFQ